MISFNCACGEPLAAAPEHAGLQVQCPKCNARLTIPAAESEFEYASDDPAPPPPPKKKRPVLVEDDEADPPAKKKAKLVDKEDKPKKKNKKKRNYGDDDEPEHVKALMAKANAELDEQEARHAREGGGIHFTPGIVGGGIAFLVGSLLFLLFLCVFAHPIVLVACGVIALGGLIRCVLSFLGQGVD